jgi:hypothetical protein
MGRKVVFVTGHRTSACGKSMKFILFMVIALVTLSAKAQKPCPPDRPPDAPCGDLLRFMEHGNVRWGDERAVLDHLADSFRRMNNQVIFFLIYPGQNSCKDEARLRALRAKKYLVQRHRIPQNDIVWKSGGFRSDLSVEIWLLPKGKPLPEPETSLTIDPSRVQLNRKCKELRQRFRHAMSLW